MRRNLPVLLWDNRWDLGTFDLCWTSFAFEMLWKEIFATHQTLTQVALNIKESLGFLMMTRMKSYVKTVSDHMERIELTFWLLLRFLLINYTLGKGVNVVFDREKLEQRGLLEKLGLLDLRDLLERAVLRVCVEYLVLLWVLFALRYTYCMGMNPNVKTISSVCLWTLSSLMLLLKNYIISGWTRTSWCVWSRWPSWTSCKNAKFINQAECCMGMALLENDFSHASDPLSV